MQEIIKVTTAVFGVFALRELKNSYPDVDSFDDTDLVESLQDIYAATKQSFVIIIDE